MFKVTKKKQLAFFSNLKKAQLAKVKGGCCEDPPPPPGDGNNNNGG